MVRVFRYKIIPLINQKYIYTHFNHRASIENYFKKQTHEALQLDDFLEDLISAELAGQCERSEILSIHQLHVSFLSMVLHCISKHALKQHRKVAQEKQLLQPAQIIRLNSKHQEWALT